MQNDICRIASYHIWSFMKIKYSIFFSDNFKDTGTVIGELLEAFRVGKNVASGNF